MAWNELIWMGTGTVGRFCDGGKEHQGSQGISWLAEELLASQGGFCAMQFDFWLVTHRGHISYVRRGSANVQVAVRFGCFGHPLFFPPMEEGQ